MFYTELTFHISPYVEDIADAIIAELGDLGYDHRKRLHHRSKLPH